MFDSKVQQLRVLVTEYRWMFKARGLAINKESEKIFFELEILSDGRPRTDSRIRYKKSLEDGFVKGIPLWYLDPNVEESDKFWDERIAIAKDAIIKQRLTTEKFLERPDAQELLAREKEKIDKYHQMIEYARQVALECLSRDKTHSALRFL